MGRLSSPFSTPPASSSSSKATENVSIRKIADRIECSPAAIYGYYERFTFAHEVKQELLSYLQRSVEEGLFPKTVAPAVAFRLLVNGLIGVATMRLSDRLSPGENADDIARDTLEVTIAGLQAGVALRSHAGLPCDLEEDTRQLAVRSTRQEPS